MILSSVKTGTNRINVHILENNRDQIGLLKIEIINNEIKIIIQSDYDNDYQSTLGERGTNLSMIISKNLTK